MIPTPVRQLVHSTQACLGDTQPERASNKRSGRAYRHRSAKNRRPVGEEFAKKAALLRAEARLARRMPYDLDPMQFLGEAMRHFYRKAKIEESLGRFCDFRIVDKAIETAARIAREIVSFRHPRISAIKLAVPIRVRICYAGT